MDSRLKERLIGAAVLVVIGVWLIPWILDGRETVSERAPQELQLPAQQDAAPLRTQTIDLGERRHANDPIAADSGTRAGSDTGAATASDGAGRADASLPAKPAPTKAPESAPAVVADAAAPGWVVQLGSFEDEANAKRQMNRVATYGYKAEVSTYRASGRLMHRVRVGPQPSRAQAEAVASSLSAHGFVAQVVIAD